MQISPNLTLSFFWIQYPGYLPRRLPVTAPDPWLEVLSWQMPVCIWLCKWGPRAELPIRLREGLDSYKWSTAWQLQWSQEGQRNGEGSQSFGIGLIRLPFLKSLVWGQKLLVYPRVWAFYLKVKKKQSLYGIMSSSTRVFIFPPRLAT